MHARFVVVASLGVAAVASALVACTDLFHGTDDILNACELDAGMDGCATVDAASPDVDAEAQADAPTPFALCLDDSAAALARARTACKWLGACETPIGKNRFAECMVGALQTYDCNVAKNRAPKGATRAFWTCLAQADECTKVDRCLYGGVTQPCGVTPNFTSCTGIDPHVRAYCIDMATPARGENCAAAGQTCVPAGNASAFCGGESFDGSACAPGCVGTALHDCDDAGINVGVDCNAYGAQSCTTVASFAACKAENGVACTPSDTVTCTNGVAIGCPSGVEENVSCRLLTGGSSCDPNAPGAQWDVSRACFNTAASTPCGATPDSCSGNTLSSCVGGVTYTTDCTGSFTGCSTSPATPDGAYARCTLPADAGR